MDLAALRPPADLDGNRWQRVPAADPLACYLTERFGHDREWEVTRLLGAAYAYRGGPRGDQVVAKFYAQKTTESPEHYAAREYAAIVYARRVLGDAVVEPFDNWRGVLLMPFAPGLTLESSIAARRNQAGLLTDRITAVGTLLARLHSLTLRPEPHDLFQAAVGYARKLVEELSRYGVLEGDPMLRQACDDQICSWAARADMHDFVPSFVHGDATTANFLLPGDERVVAIDWERAKFADPALDLGRLAAEVTHSVVQHGGSVTEALLLVDDLNDAYRRTLPSADASNALFERAKFYRAVTNLRIARNAWSPKSRRMTLVAHALALLSQRFHE